MVSPKTKGRMIFKGNEYDLFENEYGVEYIRVKGTYRPIINGKVRMFLSRTSKKIIEENPRSCELCDPQLDKLHRAYKDYEIDHILSLWRGGTDDPKNLRWLCRYHNRARKWGSI